MFKKLLNSILFCCLFSTNLQGQSFYYQSNSVFETVIKDVAEINGKVYSVGYIDSSGINKPFFSVLSKNGSLIFDTILNSSGRFTNIHQHQNELFITYYFNPFAGFDDILCFKFDTNFVFQTGRTIGSAIPQKSKLIDDSLIFYLGVLPPPIPNSVFSAYAAIYNINSNQVFENVLFTDLDSIEFSDVIKIDQGKYHVFSNSPSSATQSNITVNFLDDSLRNYRTILLKSSYGSFGSDSSLLMNANVIYDSNEIRLSCIANHPTYLNQNNPLDLAFIRYDTNYTEKSISFIGKNDTNYTSSLNTLTRDSQNFFVGGTGLGEIVLGRYNSLGILMDSVFFKKSPTVELTRILSSNDSLIVVGKVGIDYFVMKVDNLSNPLVTIVFENHNYENKRISIYPNPSNNYITIDSKDIFSRIQIIGINGKVYEVTSTFDNSINIEALPKGLYILKLFDNQNNSYTAKFLKK